MRRIIDYIKSHKELIIILFVVLLLIINQFLKPESSTTISKLTPTPGIKESSYRTIVPGSSTGEQLNKVMGEPLTTKTEGNKKISEYKSSSQYRNNIGVTENGKVSFIKEIVTIGDDKKVSDITSIYGKAPNILYEGNTNSSFNLYVYPDKGIAYLGHADGTLLEIWYFIPTNIDDFKNKWASNYSSTPNKEIPTGQLYY